MSGKVVKKEKDDAKRGRSFRLDYITDMIRRQQWLNTDFMEPLSGNSCELKTAKFDNTVDNVDAVDKFGNVDHFGTMDVYCYI